MTFGVPYSFVPGTKAKADEVNANFIDVLTKIEDTNLRIDETNSSADTKSEEISTKFEEVEQELTQRANLDLSNLSEVGSAVLDAKANSTDLDGKWTAKVVDLATNLVLSNNSSTSLSLSSYLPNDGRVYEVVFSYSCLVTATSKFNFNTGFGKSDGWYTNTTIGSGVTILPISTGRFIQIVPGLASGTNKGSFRLVAYRKVR